MEKFRGREEADEADVVVVGAGPTGLMVAGELALAGVAVEVIERQAVPSGQSRGGGVNPRTLEVLAMRGLLDAVTERAIPTESAGGHFAGLPVPLNARPWRTRYPDGLFIPQDRLEEVLEAHLRVLGVAVRRSTELTGLTNDEASVEAAVSGPSGEGVLRARYLVACDGAHNTVRKLTGVAFPGRAGTLAAVSADVELAAVSTTVPQSVSHISTLIHTGGDCWMLMHPLEKTGERTGLYRVMFGGPEQQTLSRQAPVTADEVARALTAVHGQETELRRLRWGTRFARDHHRPGATARCEPLSGRTDVRVGPALRPRRLRSAGRRTDGRPVAGDRRRPDHGQHAAAARTRAAPGTQRFPVVPDAGARRCRPGVVARVIDSPVGTALGASPGADRVLIRPDGHVCWAGAGPNSSPEPALRRWFGVTLVRAA